MSTVPLAAFGVLLLLILSRHPSEDSQLPIKFLVVRTTQPTLLLLCSLFMNRQL
jgi:hypothetical protein